MSNRNAENLLFNYLLNSLDLGSPNASYTETSRNNGSRTTTHSLTDRNVNLLIRVFDSYQRNVEMYHRNMGELIQLLRTNMNTSRPSAQAADPAPAPVPLPEQEPIRESRYRPWYFSTGTTTQQPVDSSNNTIPPETTAAATTNTSGRLNNREIDRCVSSITYSSEETETRCPISLEDFAVGENICKINNCGHIFKRAALYRWFHRHNTCPVCRCNVLPTTNNTRYNIRNTPIIENNLINDYAQSIAYSLLAGLNTNPSNLYSYTLDIPIYYDISGNGRSHNSSNYDHIFENEEPEE
jgi:hypothetical protein